MCPDGYCAMIRSKDHRFDLRMHLLRFAKLEGIRAACRHFKCSRKTVRKWLRRYEAEGTAGLTERSRAPKHCPHKTPPAKEREVLRQRARTPGFSAARLKREFGLSPSAGAIGRILRQKGLTRKRKRKHQTKRDLRAIKAKYPPLTRFQMDVKYLNDLPHYWPYYQSKGFPRFQYTTRDVRTGATFLAFANEISVTYAELTAKRLLTHLQAYGITLAEVIIQTDHGSEFDGQVVRKDDRGFTFTIEKVFPAHHRLSPPHHPNANADVESFHSLEEPEFFDIEDYKSPRDFWAKVTTYQHYFNFARLNSYKGNRSPLDILIEAVPSVSPRVLLLPPVNLHTLPLIAPGVGHHLPVEPVSSILGTDEKAVDLPGRSGQNPAPMKDARLFLRVKPGARKTRVVGPYGDRIKVEVAAPPENGKANAELLRFLRERLDLPIGSVSLAGGEASRDKQVLVSGLDLDEVRRRLLR